MADPFGQAPPAVAPDPHKREPHERIALWWRTIFPILAFLVGATLLLYQGILAKSASPTIIGVGLVLAGLGPAGLIDVIRKIP